MTPNYVIFDIDNCIADDEWRLRLIDWSLTDPDMRYFNYHRACGGDKPVNLDRIKHHRELGDSLIFITARPTTVSAETTEWLKRVLPPGTSFLLLMRNEGDGRSSVDIKRDRLCELFDPNSFDIASSQIVAAYDDRDDILAMYREYDIDGRKLQAHDQCAMTAPPPPTKVSDILHDSARLHAERKAVYRDSHLRFAGAMAALFPDGLTVRTVEEWARLGIFVQTVNKTTRYAAAFADGGHLDSALDNVVYHAMLAEATK